MHPLCTLSEIEEHEFYKFRSVLYYMSARVQFDYNIQLMRSINLKKRSCYHAHIIIGGYNYIDVINKNKTIMRRAKLKRLI